MPALEPAHRPEFIRRVLPNGLTLLVQEDHAHPLVCFHAVVKTGSATEGPWMGAGVSHVVEHMLFKGTARRPVGAVEREARSYGGTSQGYTTYDTTSYPLTVNRDYWPEAADLLVDALFSPSMDPAEFAKEREVVLRELRMRRDDPAQVAWDLLFSNAYRAHPYRLPIIGLEPLLVRLTAEEVKEYHRTRYLPNNTVIAVVGDVRADAVLRRMEELTAALPPGKVPLVALPEEPLPVAPREVTEEAQAQLGTVAVGFPGVALSDPDLAAMDLLAWILGGGRGSVLERSLRDTGVVHSVSCWDYTPKERGLFVASMRMDPERAEEAVTRLRGELRRARLELFPAEDVEAGKRTMLREYLAQRQSVSGQASDLATFEALLGDPAFAYRYLEAVQRLQPEDLRRAAQRCLAEGRATTVTLLPSGSGSTAGAERPAAAGKVVTEKVELDNGLRVILRQDRRLPLTTLQVSMMGGVRYESDQTNGLSALAARMLTRGTARQSADQITEHLRAMGGELDSFSGRNSLGLTLETVSTELPRALALAAELLQEPSFPEEELQKERRLALANLKGQEEDPFSWGMKRLMATLFTRHPYRLDPAGTAGSLSVLRREDLVRFFSGVRDPRRMVACVVGDFERDELLAQLRRTLGQIPSSGFTDPAIAAEPPLESLRERIEPAARREALVLIAFPGLKVGDPRVPALDLLQSVLSGGAGRLFLEVRERRGLAYSVGAFGLHGVDPGCFILYALTAPEHLEAVRSALLEEVRRLRTASVPEQELREAKQGLLGNRRIAQQAQGTLAAQLAGDELYGLGYGYGPLYEARMESLTAGDLQGVAKEIFDLQRYAVLVGRPDADAGQRAQEPEVAEPASRSP